MFSFNKKGASPIIIIFLLTLILTTMNMNAQKKPITPEDLYSMKRISNQAVSPDGKWVLYLETTPNIKENKMETDVFVVSIDGKNTTKISDVDGSKSHPVWSPKGDKISFVANSDGNSSIFTVSFPNGKPTRIATFNETVSSLAYSPNGEYFSFAKNVKIKQTTAEKYPQAPKANVRIYDELPMRHWDVWFDENVSHIFYMPVNGAANTAKDIMANEKFSGNYGIAWSPDSKEIAYSCKKVSGIDAARSTNSDIYIYTLATGNTVNITDGMLGYDKYPKYSPDGKYISFASQERAGFESDRIRLMLYDRTTRNISELTKNFDQWVMEYIWSKDSKSIYFTAPEKGCYHIFNRPVSDVYSLTQITAGHLDISGLSLSDDGKVLVFGLCDMLKPLDIFSMQITPAPGVPNRITNLNSDILARLEPSSFEAKWITTRDYKNLHSWVVYPPNFDSTKKYPMILFCPGGPQQMISQSYGYRWNMSLLSAKGYIIVAPNRRGCPGFGQDWVDVISKDWGGGAMNDLLDITDAMAKEKFVDENKLIAAGASAGGYSTFWLAGNHEGRFKVFLSHNGLFNLKSFYGSTEELFFTDWDFGGPYWEAKNKEFYVKNCPSTYVDKWDTPIIITIGEKDFRVPYTQGLEAFTVAQIKRIPSKLLVYPEMNHFIGKTQEYIIWYNEVFDFFEKCLRKWPNYKKNYAKDIYKQ
jgi:dipeptidyl aminopeptidase/acylaminoacyl peptidase